MLQTDQEDTQKEKIERTAFNVLGSYWVHRHILITCDWAQCKDHMVYGALPLEGLYSLTRPEAHSPVDIQLWFDFGPHPGALSLCIGAPPTLSSCITYTFCTRPDQSCCCTIRQ